MIQTLRQIRTRIKSTENTKKITRAMEMVSSSKLNRIKSAHYTSQPYFLNLENILKNLLADIKNPSHPLLEQREKLSKIAVCIIASDTGLCGPYNNNILTYAENFLKDHDKNNIRLVVVGKEAQAHFNRNGYVIASSHLGLFGRYTKKIAQDIGNELIGMFLKRDADEVYIAYSRFSARLHHTPTVEKFLPIGYEEKTENRYILEPGADRILESLIPKYLTSKMNAILLDSFTSENSARMLAMKTATDNAEDLINMLVLMRNKARQAAITKEVLEVALSAEALKG